MMHEDQQVVRVDPAELRGAREEVIGVLDDELIERGAPGDEERQALSCPSAGPSRLLPGAGYRTRIAAEDSRLQIANVDPQL